MDWSLLGMRLDVDRDYAGTPPRRCAAVRVRDELAAERGAMIPVGKRTITVHAVTKSAAEWSAKRGLTAKEICRRIDSGEPPEQIIAIDAAEIVHSVGGITLRAREGSEKTGVSLPMILDRIARGWAPNRAVHDRSSYRPRRGKAGGS